MAAAKRKKTAWYMMGIVGLMLAVIVVFLPINNSSESEISDSIFTKIITFSGFKPRPKPQTKIILGGDVMLGRSVMATSLDKSDTKYPFLKIAERLSSADLVFVNLENAIVRDCPKVYENTLKFCTLPSMLEGVKLAGIDVVTLANNHSKNYGEEGFQETKEHLSEAGISYAGDGNLVVKELNRTKFGFLGFNFVINEPTEDDYNLISESNKEVDVLILSIHWGVEYTPEPRKNQRDLAVRFVENGADLVVGHHPHWVQTSENINGVPVYYSLGNLVFDQMWSEKTKTGLLVEAVFEGEDIVRTKELTTYMSRWAQPEVVNEGLNN